MKKTVLALAALAFLSLPASAHAAPGAKSYQVTGPVLDVSNRTVTVQKGDEKWQINLGAGALPADLKVGAIVTIQYTMQATKIEVKGAKDAVAATTSAPEAAAKTVTAATATTKKTAK